MKRCDSCGWVNPVNAAACEQCKAALDGSRAQTPQNNITPSGFDAKKTVRGAAPNMPFWDETPQSNPVNPSQNSSSALGKDCPRCGYPNLAGEASCANCGTQLVTQNEPPQRQQPVQPPLQNPFQNPAPGFINPQQPSGFASGNNENYRHAANMSNPKKTTRLGDVFKNFGSQFVLRDINSNRAAEFSGESVSLNRGNLDPNNNSISSQEHVVLEFKNNCWHLTDRSTNGATFVQAVYPNIPLQNGMLIMIGNKIYRFEADN
jgi:hypothetical protein